MEVKNEIRDCKIVANPDTKGAALIVGASKFVLGAGYRMVLGKGTSLDVKSDGINLNRAVIRHKDAHVR